jgi:hypothetical protein
MRAGVEPLPALLLQCQTLVGNHILGWQCMFLLTWTVAVSRVAAKSPVLLRRLTCALLLARRPAGTGWPGRTG